MSLHLSKTAAFGNEAAYSGKHTGEGEDVSPR